MSFGTHWNRENIAAERRVKLAASGLTAEQLRERVVALETALYPFAYVCGSLGDKCGSYATSKLFPLEPENGKFTVWANGKSSDVDSISLNSLHEADYFEADSIDIRDGTLLDDRLEILAVHQSAPAAYVSCGAITMGDARHAQAVLASADTLPEGQDAQQGLAGTESGAVGAAETPNPSPSPAAGR